MSYSRLIIAALSMGIISCSDSSTTKKTSADSPDIKAVKDSIHSASVKDSTPAKPPNYYWEQLPIRTVAELILTDSIRPVSSPVTYKMLDSLSADSKQTRQFYFKVFNKIMNKADGELAESIGGYALTYVQNYPKEFLDNTRNFSRNNMEAWASNIGIELFLGSSDNIKEAFDQVVVLFTDNCKDCNSYYKKRLKEFNSMIWRTLQENQQAQK